MVADYRDAAWLRAPKTMLRQCQEVVVPRGGSAKRLCCEAAASRDSVARQQRGSSIKRQ